MMTTALKDRKDANLRGEVEELKNSPMMAHLLEALERGEDIGHFGRLTFVMVARHFLNEHDLLKLLSNQPGHDEHDMLALIEQVKTRGYSPPRRERILQWQERQEFPICPDSSDPASCNVYRELKFPEEVYDSVQEFWEEKSESD